jgi:hypothetical protein
MIFQQRNHSLRFFPSGGQEEFEVSDTAVRDHEYEKRDEPVTFRTSGRKAAWLNDVARVLGVERSFLCHEVMSNYLENQEGVRTRAYRTREAETLRKALEAASDAFHCLVMAPSTTQILRKRRVS